MRWLLGTFDRLLGTVFAACFGIAASQTQAYLTAYLQRLGGHLDEARRSLAMLRSGELMPGGDAGSVAALSAAFERRVDDLVAAHHAIAGADVFARPLVFLQHLDRAIADAALTNFSPALPLDSASLTFTLVGIVAGWLLYGGLTLPLRLLGRRRHAAA